MSQSTQSFSKKLLNFSLENGRVNRERVSAILETLKTHPPRHFKKILESYLLKIKTELRKENALIEYAGSLEEDVLNKIQIDLNKYYNRNIAITTIENPKLLAGLKIYAADDIWDSSIMGHLELLAKSL